MVGGAPLSQEFVGFAGFFLPRAARSRTYFDFVSPRGAPEGGRSVRIVSYRIYLSHIFLTSVTRNCVAVTQINPECQESGREEIRRARPCRGTRAYEDREIGSVCVRRRVVCVVSQPTVFEYSTVAWTGSNGGLGSFLGRLGRWCLELLGVAWSCLTFLVVFLGLR